MGLPLHYPTYPLSMAVWNDTPYPSLEGGGARKLLLAEYTGLKKEWC